jgi:hypothetical protein
VSLNDHRPVACKEYPMNASRTSPITRRHRHRRNRRDSAVQPAAAGRQPGADRSAAVGADRDATPPRTIQALPYRSGSTSHRPPASVDVFDRSGWSTLAQARSAVRRSSHHARREHG